MTRHLCAQAAATVLFAIQACVFPPDLETYPPPPGEGQARPNAPVLLDPTALEPQQPFITIARSCPEFTFAAGVPTDADVGDTLDVRWYVDGTGIACLVRFPPSNQPERPELRFTLVPADYPDSEVHTIEVMVADRPFADDPAVEPENRGFEPSIRTVVKTARAAWSFRVADGGACTSGTKPSTTCPY